MSILLEMSPLDWLHVTGMSAIVLLIWYLMWDYNRKENEEKKERDGAEASKTGK
jgi:hypothetical protein